MNKTFRLAAMLMAIGPIAATAVAAPPSPGPGLLPVAHVVGRPAHISCALQRTSSGFFDIRLTNDGPGVVPAGTRVHWRARLSWPWGSREGNYTLSSHLLPHHHVVSRVHLPTGAISRGCAAA